MNSRVSWEQLAAIFEESAAAGVAQSVPRDAAHFAQTLAFAVGRLQDGREVGEWLARSQARPLRILDVGSGNGGVAHGVGNVATNDVHAIDIIPNSAFLNFRRALGGAKLVTQTVGSGKAIPFRDETFDVVLCLETLEHVDDPGPMGREIMRVLRRGGFCMVMTPARVKHLFRRDPHYGVRGLLLLPDALQKFVVTRLLRRTKLYDVTHTFWTLRGIAALFPGHTDVEPLFNSVFPPGTIFYTFRKLLWDRILIFK